MRIPDVVKVGPFIYRVERPAIVDRNKRERIGQVDHDALIISVEAGLRSEKAEECFLHEVLHAVDEFMGVGLTESQVSQLSNGLYMVLRENELLKDDEPKAPLANVVDIAVRRRQHRAA